MNFKRTSFVKWMLDHLYGVGLVLLLLTVGFFIIGPSRISTYVTSWRTKAYGAHWLVIERANNGKVIQYWELRNKTILNEPQSDGIYFPDKDGLMVHLSGKYLFIEIRPATAKMWEIARRRYLKGKRR